MRRTLNISFNNDACNSFTYSTELDHADASANITYRHLGDISALINQIKVTIPHESYSVNDPMYMAHAEALSRQLRGHGAHAPIGAELITAHISNVELEWLIDKYKAAANKPVVDPTPAGRKRMVNFVNNMTRGQYTREQVEEIVEKIIKDACSHVGI